MELYKIWSTFNLKGDAFEKIKLFSELTKKASLNVTSLNEKLLVTSVRLSSLNLTLNKLNPTFSVFSSSFAKLNINAKENRNSFSEYNKTLSSTEIRTKNLVRDTDRLALRLGIVAEKSRLAGAGLAEMTGGGMLGAASGASRRARGSLKHGLSRGLGVSEVVGGFGLPTLAAFGAGSTLVHGFNVASDYQMLLGQLSALGYSPEQKQKANNYVLNTDIPGVSHIQMLQAFIDAQMATREMPQHAIGNQSESKVFAPILAKTKFAANIMYGGMSDQEEKNLIRFAEIMGGSSLEKRKQFLDVAAQIMVSSGGSIRPTELRTFARQAGGAFSNLTPAALAGLEPVLQESGGAKLATGLVTGLRQLITGTGSNFNKKQVNFLENIGLLKANYDREGRPLGVKMPDKYSKIAGSDPFSFLTDVILPLLKKSGIDMNDPMAVSNAINLGFGRTYANQLQIMLKSRGNIERQRSQLQNIGGAESQYELGLSMNKAAPQLVSAAWSDFSKAIGDLTSPMITGGLKFLAESLEGIAKFIEFFSKTPEEKKKIMENTSNNIRNLYKNSGILTKYDEIYSSGMADAFSPTGIGAPNFFGISKPSGAISSANNPNKNSSSPINLYVDSKKMATALLPSMTNMISGGGVVGGSAYGNVSLTPYSVNYNNVGSP